LCCALWPRPQLTAEGAELVISLNFWVVDITYIATGEGWLYLTVNLDARSRKVAGWAMGISLKASLVT
jgi:transposase InsO family protein